MVQCLNHCVLDGRTRVEEVLGGVLMDRDPVQNVFDRVVFVVFLKSHLIESVNKHRVRVGAHNFPI